MLKQRQDDAESGRKRSVPTAPYSALVEQAGDAFFVHDAAGNILDANPRAFEMLGYTRDELLTKTIQQIDPDLFPPHAEKLLADVLAGKQCTLETRLEQKEGGLIPVEITISALCLPEARLFLGIVRDISKRKDMEQAYKQLIDHMSDAAQVIGLDGAFLAVNQRATELLGYSERELLTLGIADIDCQLAAEEIQSIIDDTGSGSQRILETHQRAKDGRTIPVEVGLSAVPYLGQPAVLAIVRDVTQRKQSEEALRALTRRTQAIVQTIPDIIAEVDTERIYTWVNEAGLHFFGEDVIGKAAADYFVNEQDTLESVKPLFTGDSDTRYVESWQRRQDGESRLLVWCCRSLRDDSGQVIGALSTARDITERRQAEITRDARLRLLEMAQSSSVEDFVRAALREMELLTVSRLSFCNLLAADQRSLTTGLWAECVGESRPLVYNDYRDIPDHKGVPQGHPELKRLLTVPVFRSGKVAAAFAVANKPSDYTAGDVETVSSLADLAWDTAASKQAETMLQESDDRNRRLFDSSPDAVFLSEPGGHFLDCNQTAIDTYGYSREEILQMTYKDLAAIDLRNKAGGHVRETLALGGTVFEWRHRRKDGSELPVEIRTAPFVTHGEQRIMATIRNLTEAKAAQEALQRSEQEFRKLFAAAPVGIGVADMHGRLLAFNDAMLLPGGYRPSDIERIANVGALYFDPTERETALALFHAQGFLRQHETCFKRKDDTPYDVWLSLTHTTFEGAPCILAIVEDRTEKRRAEEALRKSEEQLRQAAKMESIGRLAGGVAHDFNNMLAVILGHIELALAQIASDEPLFADLQEVRKAANRSASITQQLLAFARRQVAIPKVIDLNKSVEGLMGMLRRLIGEQVELAWLPGHNLGRVQIDPSQLDQVLVNLCLNARDAVEGAGQVTIATTEAFIDQGFCEEHESCIPGDYVLLSVGDNGIGMSAEALEHMFEPFFTTKDMDKGTGLGLATVYGVVRQNGGFIQVDSSPAGTEVRIHLPRIDADPTPEELELDHAAPPGGPETLLVVEDEPSVLKLIERILLDLDYTVLSARSPIEALRIAEDHPADIDLVVTDIVMPEMDGWELSKRLCTLRPGLKTLYVSGYTDDMASEGRAALDSLNFVQKPFTPRNIAAAVRSALDQE